MTHGNSELLVPLVNLNLCPFAGSSLSLSFSLPSQEK
jgi:hypothetical protein